MLGLSTGHKDQVFPKEIHEKQVVITGSLSNGILRNFTQLYTVLCPDSPFPQTSVFPGVHPLSSSPGCVTPVRSALSVP